MIEELYEEAFRIIDGALTNNTRLSDAEYRRMLEIYRSIILTFLAQLKPTTQSVARKAQPSTYKMVKNILYDDDEATN